MVFYSFSYFLHHSPEFSIIQDQFGNTTIIIQQKVVMKNKRIEEKNIVIQNYNQVHKFIAQILKTSKRRVK